MKLKKGDTVRFDNPSIKFAANKWATAIYQGTTYTDEDGGELITVKWVRDGNDNGQNDGEYYLHMSEKVEEVSTQEQARYVKPKTFLTKLLEHNEKEKQRFEEYNKQTALLNATLTKYKTLYPSATVTSGRDYAKYLGSFDTVKVEFESGSWIEFRIDVYNDRDVLFKKKDVEYDNLSPEELLERFSKQVKKEGSN